MTDINKRFAARIVSNYIYAKHKKHITPSSMSVECSVVDDTQVYVVIAGDYKYMVLSVSDTYTITKIEELNKKGENL